jgi:acyl-CoA thioesterase I
MIEKNETVLFQGDSVTDAGRDYASDSSLGQGYAGMVGAWFSAAHPEKHVRFVNRGISGHRAKDLAARWHRDTLDLAPDWVSILIGINDCWRRYDSNDPTPVEEFEETYGVLLTQVREKLGARLILLEPFVLPVPDDRRDWREDLDPKIQAVRRLACEFQAIYLPLDGLFASAAAHTGPAFWAADGVHPTPAGHALIAQTWLRAVRVF